MDFGSIIDGVSGSIQGGWRVFLDLIEDTPFREFFGQIGRIIDDWEGSVGINPDDGISDAIQGSVSGSLGSSAR
ncbi:MAG: hypothetical protein ACTH1D_10195 [Mycobacteriaceae bacterium]|uniref:hypothetical protein n=1 Tax=Corynebacterium sp. TaxID=1720 RepID=UPI003F996566